MVGQKIYVLLVYPALLTGGMEILTRKEMKMEAKRCDRCGAYWSGKDENYASTIKSRACKGASTAVYDLCQDCAKALTAWWNNATTTIC